MNVGKIEQLIGPPVNHTEGYIAILERKVTELKAENARLSAELAEFKRHEPHKVDERNMWRDKAKQLKVALAEARTLLEALHYEHYVGTTGIRFCPEGCDCTGCRIAGWLEKENAG